MIMEVLPQSRPNDINVNEGKSTLQLFEIEASIGTALRDNMMEIIKAFQMYDVDKKGFITQGELRRILENFCCPLTTEQFNNLLTKMNLNSSGAVPYQRFLNRFKVNTPATPIRRSMTMVGLERNGNTRLSTPSSILSESKLISPTLKRIKTENFIDTLRQRVVEKRDILIKAFRLFDYNRDKRVKEQEFRKVLENYCQPISDEQFQRLCKEMCSQSGGLIHYEDFIRQIITTVPSSNASAGRPNQVVVLSKGNVQGMNIDAMEVKFRALMKRNYAILYKVLRSFDSLGSGFVNIEDLISVLNQFIFPMDDHQLAEIMRRCDIKASSKIAWLTFLEKFQDPYAEANGQTLPIRSNHKCNPIKGADLVADLDSLLSLLYDHIINSYSSLKQAFLSIDKTRKGYVTPKELRQLLNRYSFIIPKELLPKINEIIDPTRSGRILYQHFLRIFEQRESIDAHKWLKSVHRSNDPRHASLRDQKAFQELLREKLTNNWNQLTILTRRLDSRGDGFLSNKNLLQLFEETCFPVSSEQLASLTSQLGEESFKNKKLNYLDLFKLLQIDARPSDILGLSTQVTLGSQAARADRLQDHLHRMEMIEDNARHRTDVMPIAELMIRLQDRLRQHRTEIRNAFKQVDREQKSQISAKELRKVMLSYGFVMDDEQFDAVCQELGISSRGNGIDYMLFVDRFVEKDFSHIGSQASYLPLTNHRVNPIRGEEWGMTAEEAEKLVRQKIIQNFSTLRGVFHKLDDSGQGYLSKDDFRRLLDSFMCNLTDDEFERLCQKLKIVNGERIIYKQFLDRFEIRESLEEGHKWLESKHRYNHLQMIQSQKAQEIILLLPNKVHQNYNDVSRAFCKTDVKGRGFVTRREFKEMLVRMHFIFSPEEFKHIWNFYDVAGRGALTYDDFLHRMELGKMFASGDEMGPSSKIINNSHQTILEHLQGQKERQTNILQNNIELVKEYSLEQLQELIKIRIRDDFHDPYTAFRAYDLEKKGFLTWADFKRLLVDCNVLLTTDNFTTLMRSLGLVDKKSQMNYEQFGRVFDEAYSGKKTDEIPTGPLIGGTSYEGLDPVKAEELLRKSLGKQADILEKTFASFDREQSGKVSQEILRNILKSFSGSLSEQQIKYLQDKCQTDASGLVDYKCFLNLLKSSDIFDVDLSQDYPPPAAPPLVQINETFINQLSESLREELSGKADSVMKSLKALDTENSGLISELDFRKWFEGNISAIRLNDAELKELWHILPKYHDKLQWRQFCKKFIRDQEHSVNLLNIKQPINRTRRDEEITSGNEKILNEIDEIRQRSETVINVSMREAIMKHWQQIFNDCKSVADRDHRIELSQFINLLHSYNVNLLPGELSPLLKRFNFRTSDKSFEYAPFLRSMLTTSRLVNSNENLDTVRHKLKTAGFLVSRDDANSQEILSPLARIRQILLIEWRSLRRLFRTYDSDNKGFITNEQFKKGLKQFVSPVNETDLAILVHRFDPEITGCIRYNEFLRTFLSTT